jgi:hypothetical protein
LVHAYYYYYNREKERKGETEKETITYDDKGETGRKNIKKRVIQAERGEIHIFEGEYS